MGYYKKCSWCKYLLREDEISPSSNYCKECIARHRAQKVYKLTDSKYGQMFTNQNGLCAICNGKCNRRLAVDHDHKTGKVRGLLCIRCNFLLGYAKDNEEILENAILYLRTNS